jgi:hypothetical protein
MSDRKNSELEQRLVDIRARRAELDKLQAVRSEERDLAELVEREERELKDREAIAAAEAEHGPLRKRIAAVHTDLGVVILKRSNPLMFRRFQDAGTLKSEHLDKLVRPCVVHPDLPTFDRILEELPATLLRCANAVSELAGVRAEEVTGKS